MLRLKDVCAFSAENPHATWDSLQKMLVVAEDEHLVSRSARSLACEFKTGFQEELISRQLQIAQDHSSRYLEYLTSLLAVVKRENDEGLQRRSHATLALQSAVEDREQCKLRLLALVAKLAEAKRKNQTLLQQLTRCRASYEKAVTMRALLQNVKMDPIFKSWSAVGEYHTASIVDWYALRSECASDIERLEHEIRVLSLQLERLRDSVEQRQLQWVAASVADVQVCERAGKLQDLVHVAVERIVEAEEARVFHLLSSFDLRQRWLSHGSLRRLHESSSVSKDGEAVNQTLVQLSIARLDTIKQEKRFDLLARKLRAYEHIREQEIAKQQVRSVVTVQHSRIAEGFTCSRVLLAGYVGRHRTPPSSP